MQAKLIIFVAGADPGQSKQTLQCIAIKTSGQWKLQNISWPMYLRLGGQEAFSWLLAPRLMNILTLSGYS